MNVAAEAEDFRLGAVDDLELEGGTGVIVPDLDGIDAVPVRTFAARQ
jgi:hypothetical protein